MLTKVGTTGTDWLEANSKNPDASHLEDVDFPKYFTCSIVTKVWASKASMHVSQKGSKISTGT